MKYVKYLSYALLIISAILLIAFYATGYADGLLTASLNWAYVLLAVAVLATLILPFFFKSGRGGKGSIIKIGVMVVLCVVSYLCASNAPLEVSVNVETTPSTLKWTDAGLILTVILFIGAVLSIFSGFFFNLFKHR